MPKVNGRVISSEITDNKMIAVVQLDGKLPKPGEIVSLKWGSTRSVDQNSLYWKWLTWLIDEGGLKEAGHFSAEALHMDLKAHFKKDTTTQMNKSEFGEYFDEADKFVCSFFEISTAPFWSEYEEYKS